jgi:type I restriction enzyme R subunit
MRNIMESKNFEILRAQWPDLASLAGFAEQYAHSDPASSLIKQRTFIERLVDWLTRFHQIMTFPNPNLFDQMNDPDFQKKIPPVVQNKLHFIRQFGNKAAHGWAATPQPALDCLRECYDLARWLFVTHGQGKAADCPAFAAPEPEPAPDHKKAESKAALAQLAAKEAELQHMLADLEKARAEALRAQKTAEEWQAIVKAGQQAAHELKFDEETTRSRLIDTMLVETGWNVCPKQGNTSEVARETEVLHQPTATGKGYADYVLYDDNGKPLAVIEAKKTAVSPDQGKTQARLYADGLEKMTGQRPVIFYTNGFEVFIWDDKQGYPPRHLFGFYSKDSLQYLIHQRAHKKTLNTISPNSEIIDRLYQTIALQEVCDKFTGMRRKALVVQATGTGKTRVAIALVDKLLRAGWVKRVLFLCDRLELRRQAKNTFTHFIKEPLVEVKGTTAHERDKRIYLGTYPAMLKVFQTFDTGFFDLIIADESHRSIYNRYRDLFKYFDCLQVGLTATPIEKVHRNTFRLFDCEEGTPTYHYSLEQAVKDAFLVPYEVFAHTTRFLRQGIKFPNLTEEQCEQLEEDGENPEGFNFEVADLDRKIFNKDTNRVILRNLMENGIREATEQRPGKTIIFARNHQHAVLLSQVFDELYPQYGGSFCQVIDHYNPRAEQLIDDFKDPQNPLTIAISVDMLDTGIDVPEIVNLVFARPVFTWVKFWQMIGRGTRLRKDLFGPGKHKTRFRIFDHWENFSRFEVAQPEADAHPTPSLLQRLFEARLALAEEALNKGQREVFQAAIALIQADINSLPEESIAVKEKWREKRTLAKAETLEGFSPDTVRALRLVIAPLMQWVPPHERADAWRFDLVMTSLQTEHLRASGLFDDYRDRALNMINSLPLHLNPVREKLETIARAKDPAFWVNGDFEAYEGLRRDLRGIMHHRVLKAADGEAPKTIDIRDDGVVVTRRASNIPDVDRMIFRNRVEEVLKPLFEKDPTLLKIRRAEPVSPNDLNALTSLVLTQHPDVDLGVLREYFPDVAGPLDFVIRTIIGLDRELVAARFADFARLHPKLTVKQMRFLQLLQNHISQNGTITLDRLYEPPFTTIDHQGIDGIFEDETLINSLSEIIHSFEPPTPKGVTQ